MSKITISSNTQCVVPENIHIHRKEGRGKSEGEGVSKAKCFNGKCEVKLETPGEWEGEVSNQKTFCGALSGCRAFCMRLCIDIVVGYSK